MNFFDEPFFTKPLSDYEIVERKEIGMVVHWFSKVYDRSIFVGEIKYETTKNYRCKAEFEEFKNSNVLSVPTVVFMYTSDTAAMPLFKNMDNLFVNRTDEISKIENKILCRVKTPKLKKNGKPAKHYSIERKKRFTIPITNVMTSDMRLIGSATLSCTFLDLV